MKALRLGLLVAGTLAGIRVLDLTTVLRHLNPW